MNPKPFLRSWRVWLLAWAVMAAPQVTLVHALAHLAPAVTSSAALGEDDNSQTPHAVCEVCAVLAQLGGALPTPQHAWREGDPVAVAPLAAAVRSAQPAPAYRAPARGPPSPRLG